LLDMDLLWRSMENAARQETMDRGEAIGVGSLIAAGLEQSMTRFQTPVNADDIGRLAADCAKEPTARLLRNPAFSAAEILRSAWEEPKRKEGLQLLFRTFFPQAAYMRQKYPDSSRWALPWLYVRRIFDGFRK
ncbi:MAG: hypothetical protein RQ826_16665, partial [Xanthomonadales bacterium]|nr:hypothetical protein [Xanthomonadales bacterium]